MAVWSKKTYVMVAAALRSCRNGRIEQEHAIDNVMWQFIEEFEDDNKRFDRQEFMVAAGYEEDDDD